MRSKGWRDPPRGLLIAAAAAVTLLPLFHKVCSYDVWFHLRAGEWLLAGGGFPAEDPFSFTANARWINLSWLFQIPLALAHRVGAAAGITVLNAILLLGMMALIIRRALRAGVALESAILLVALATLASAQRLLVRPESLSLLFLVLAIWLAEGALRGRTRRLWAFPALQLLWVNSEALFPLGLGVLGAA
ncbi:MAG: hypothetical protein GF330_12635, partial [Candidatus Eisenbacteria bacterium]|nr:hypothetical protein [Candidatus Eisenbacteria bacterium]